MTSSVVSFDLLGFLLQSLVKSQPFLYNTISFRKQCQHIFSLESHVYGITAMLPVGTKLKLTQSLLEDYSSETVT